MAVVEGVGEGVGMAVCVGLVDCVHAAVCTTVVEGVGEGVRVWL